MNDMYIVIKSKVTGHKVWYKRFADAFLRYKMLECCGKQPSMICTGHPNCEQGII